MTYRWEPTTPLDRILEEGFKRIDEAVEGVIGKYPAPTYHKFAFPDPVLGSQLAPPFLGGAYLGLTNKQAQKIYNKNLLNMVVDNATMSHNPAFGGTNL